MTLKELKLALAEGANIEAMVLAADPATYLLQVTRSDSGASNLPITLQNGVGRNLVYKSRYAADQAFAQAGVTRVTLVHESAYGEMVGLDVGDSSDTRMAHSYPVTLDTDAL